jgi:hypothetical protein
MAAPEFLSDDWHALAARLGAELPHTDGADATIVFVVAGGPNGEARYVQELVAGQLRAQHAIDAKHEANARAHVTFSLGWDDALAMHRGDLDVNVAFMEGRMKVAGDMRRLFPLLKLTSSAEYQTLRAALVG